MKNSVFVLTLLSFTGIMNLDSGWAMMPTIENVSRIVVKKRAPLQMTHKRSLHTQGYKPDVKSYNFSYLKLPKNVQFLDEDHEVFINPSPEKQHMKVFPPDIQKENDHTLGVDLKKK